MDTMQNISLKVHSTSYKGIGPIISLFFDWFPDEKMAQFFDDLKEECELYDWKLSKKTHLFILIDASGFEDVFKAEAIVLSMAGRIMCRMFGVDV